MNNPNIQYLPRILVVSRGVWDDNEGTSSTLTNLFSDYDPDRVAHIYTQTLRPNTKCCNHFFQISEIALVKKLFHWNLKTGRVVPNNEGIDSDVTKDASDEKKIYKLVRGRRLAIYSFLQDILWSIGGWKIKELKEFIKSFNPDAVWIDDIVTIYMCRLYLYVLNVAKKPAVLYMQDDNYTYESMSGRRYLKRFILRQYTKRISEKCKTMFVISPKMKREFDKEFNRDSVIVTKGIDYSNLTFHHYQPHKPIRILYLGQLIYGRIYSIELIASALDSINNNEVKAILDIYTNTLISDNLKEKLTKKESVVFHEPVPYSQVQNLMNDANVLLFVESLNPKYNKDARLSFSTKITDYLGSGKCVFAVGPLDSASIEYFKQEDSAIVASTTEEIKASLEILTTDNVINEYALKGFECGRKNHEKQMMNDRVVSELVKLAKNI